MARQITECYLPMTLEHDIRYPPIGRAVSARVVDLPDGEHALEVVSEVFEQGDSVDSLAGDGRRMTVRSESTEKFAVHYDRAFAGPEDAELLDKLRGLAPADPRPSEYGKKSLEPVPTLMILAGGLALGSIGRGFLERLGEEIYENLRDFLVEHWRTRRARDEVLDLCFCVTHQARPLEIHVLLSRPSPRDIQRLFDSGLKTVDDRLAVSYVVRGDCVPVPIDPPQHSRSDVE
jgi:hypothetical protein